MGRISVELVPRHKDSFIKELEIVKKHFPSVDTINVPDILRYELRSLEGSKFVKTFFSKAIPHLRAVAIDKDKPLAFKDFLIQNGIYEVLIILGDIPETSAGRFHPSTTIEVIRKFKIEMPQVKVYAGIDQYRAEFKEEYEYIQRKIDAGADGFFTQPFFDLRLMELYAKKLNNIEIFWGVSPVTTERAKHYWETKNNVTFPSDFEPTLEWSRTFARKVLQFTKKTNAHIYFMPIKTDILAYLTGII